LIELATTEASGRHRGDKHRGPFPARDLFPAVFVPQNGSHPRKSRETALPCYFGWMV
jgi:hypothetical protein